MRVCLFTDTLGDVNGVSRFIGNVAAQALEFGRDLRVLTSTSFDVPELANVENFAPVLRTKMPRYEQLEAVLPPAGSMLRRAMALSPDAVHISTPGPVGLVGLMAARRLGVPVLGVYHTDFPSYIDHLFRDDAYTKATRTYMRLFYRSFASLFTRSRDYSDALVELGIRRDRIVPLKPGIRTREFGPSFRDPDVWQRLELQGIEGVGRDGVKVLYVGRVSIEKNMPLLERVWREVDEQCRARAIDADLVVVGDGPYRAHMQRSLAGRRAHFTGFRRGAELSSIYASSDVFVFPSLTDTLGQVVMEAQASGVPVVVSDEGGPKEVVLDGRTGRVVVGSDEGGWTRRIMELVEDPSARARMGHEAASWMAGHDIGASFEHFWAVHEQACRRGDEKP